MTAQAQTGTVVPPGEGKSLSFLGQLFTFKLLGKVTRSASSNWSHLRSMARRPTSTTSRTRRTTFLRAIIPL